MLESFPGTNQY